MSQAYTVTRPTTHVAALAVVGRDGRPLHVRVFDAQAAASAEISGSPYPAPNTAVGSPPDGQFFAGPHAAAQTLASGGAPCAADYAAATASEGCFSIERNPLEAYAQANEALSLQFLLYASLDACDERVRAAQEAEYAFHMQQAQQQASGNTQPGAPTHPTAFTLTSTTGPVTTAPSPLGRHQQVDRRFLDQLLQMGGYQSFGFVSSSNLRILCVTKGSPAQDLMREVLYALYERAVVATLCDPFRANPRADLGESPRFVRVVNDIVARLSLKPGKK